MVDAITHDALSSASLTILDGNIDVSALPCFQREVEAVLAGDRLTYMTTPSEDSGSLLGVVTTSQGARGGAEEATLCTVVDQPSRSPPELVYPFSSFPVTTLLASTTSKDVCFVVFLSGDMFQSSGESCVFFLLKARHTTCGSRLPKPNMLNCLFGLAVSSPPRNAC